MSFKKATDKKWLEGRSKYPTGFCATINVPEMSQGHEGTSPRSWNGKPMRVCTDIEHCPCECHYQIDQMYAMINQPRPEPEQSPAYLAYLREVLAEFEMPDVWESPVMDPLSSPDGTDAPPDDERPVATLPVPALGGISAIITTSGGQTRYTPTPTGRRARGQLEFDVLFVCDEFARDVYEWEYCTPKLIAERIGIMNQTEPPSTGAINAVWDRWEKLGFAKQDKKPSRFVGFVIDGSHETLERLKNNVRKNKRLQQAEQRRGTLRPRATKR